MDPVGHFVIKRIIMIESKQLETGEFGKGKYFKDICMYILYLLYMQQ